MLHIKHQNEHLPFKGILLITLLAIMYSCKISKNNSLNSDLISNKKIINDLSMFESEVLASCPISKGPSEVIKYLENLKGFQRNKEYDFGNGSIRFNAKNAKLNGFDLIDDKSLFLLNFDTNNENSYEGWWLFQAIYYYNKSGDKEIELNRILKVLNENLRLKKEIHYDGLGNPYERYTLSNETGFNLKHGSRNNQHIIDILWAPPEK